MSYTSPDTAGDPYTQFRIVKARKEWPCTFAEAGGNQCDGTIRAGQEYVDETVVPWAPLYDEVGDDWNGYPQIGQVGTVGEWTHIRYHRRCESEAVGRQYDAEMFGTAEEQRAEEERQAAEFAAWENAEKNGQAARRERQQRDSRKARRQREIAANDGPGPDGHHVITGECFACMVGVATGPESHGDHCPRKTRAGSTGTTTGGTHA